jgi:hypothetical protein
METERRVLAICCCPVKESGVVQGYMEGVTLAGALYMKQWLQWALNRSYAVRGCVLISTWGEAHTKTHAC